LRGFSIGNTGLLPGYIGAPDARLSRDVGA